MFLVDVNLQCVLAAVLSITDMTCKLLLLISVYSVHLAHVLHQLRLSTKLRLANLTSKFLLLVDLVEVSNQPGLIGELPITDVTVKV